MPRPQRLVDFQFLAMAAAGLVIVTREILPVLLLTVVIALVMLAYEAGARRYCRRIDFGGASTDDVSGPLSDADLSRWKSVIDRTLRSND